MAAITLTAGQVLAINLAITAASTAYQIAQQKKAEAKAKKEADKRKGFELPVEGEAAAIPVVYGRNLLGGIRVFHEVSSQYNHATTPSNCKEFLSLASEAASGTVLNTDTNNLIDGSLVPGGIDGEQYLIEDSYIDQNTGQPIPIFAQRAKGGLTSSKKFNRRNLLFFQQVLCHGEINDIIDVVIDEDRYLDNEEFKPGIRINAYTKGGFADPMMAVNFPERARAFFGNANGVNFAYASVVLVLNRNEPQFGGSVPSVQFLVEGTKVYTINRSGTVGNYTYSLSSSKTYTNNPAYCLLDYLTNPNYGKGLPLNQVDLGSFYNSAQVCNTIVMSNAAVQGKIYSNTTKTRNTFSRNIPLYECNTILDTSTPIRDNIETLLETMPGARLIWSGGQYKLSLQYPKNNSEIILADTLTDDDIVKDTIRINWPSVDTKLNYATVKFYNEHLNFKEDTVSFPNKSEGTRYQGVGELYPATTNTPTSWPTFLRAYGVWMPNSTASSFNATWSVYIPSSGQYKLDFATSTAGGTLSVNGSVLLSTLKNSISQQSTISLTQGIHSITVTATDNKKERAIGWRIANASTSVEIYSSRGAAYTSASIVETNNDLYLQFLAEDNNLALESQFFEAGTTDPYHALAKAEQIVRTSRDAVTYELNCYFKGLLYEPGDIIKLNSQFLGQETLTEYIIIEECQFNDNSTVTIKGQRFSPVTLAWNVDDNVYINPTQPGGRDLNKPLSVLYTPIFNDITTSGTLSWDPSSSNSVSNYDVYYWYGGPVFNDSLGYRIPESLLDNSYIVRLKTQSVYFSIINPEGSFSDYDNWIGGFTGITLANLINQSLSLPTALAVIPAGLSNSQFLDTVSQRLLDRIIEGDEYQDLFDKLNRGISRGAIIEEILNLQEEILSNFVYLGNTTTNSFVLPLLKEGYYGFIIRANTTLGTKSEFSPADQLFIVTKFAIDTSLFPRVELTFPTAYFLKNNDNTIAPEEITLTATTYNFTNPIYQWYLNDVLEPTAITNSLSVLAFEEGSKTVRVVVTEDGTNITATDIETLVVLGSGAPGISPPQRTTGYLYQWSTVTPLGPTGTSIFNWEANEFTSYTGGNNWLLDPPSNPGIPGIKLWVVSLNIVDASEVLTTEIDWDNSEIQSSLKIYSPSQNGVDGIDGLQSADITVYKWDITIPSSPVGTSIYTWIDGTINPIPNTWFATPPASPSPGFTLWAATIKIVEPSTVATTTVNWTSATIGGIGYAGEAGPPGAPGSTARAVSLNAPTSAFAYNSLGTTPTPANTTISATALNTSGTVFYEFLRSGNLVINSQANSFSYTPPSNFSSMPEVIRVNIREGSSSGTILASDQLSIIGLKETINGTDGLSAITIEIPNNSHTLPASSLGVVSSYLNSGTIIRVYEGTTALSAVSSLSANSQFTIGTPVLSPASSVTVGARSYAGTTATIADHSAMGNAFDTLTITYPISIRRSNGTNTTINAVQTLTKSKAGNTGSSGINAVLSNEAHVFPASSTGVVSDYANSGTRIYVYDGATLLDYNGVGTTAGTWRISTTSATNITVGSFTDSGSFLTVNAHSGVANGIDVSSIRYIISGVNTNGTSFSIEKDQTFTKSKTGANPQYVIVNGEQVFKYTSGASTPTPTSITLSATLYGGLSIYDWEYWTGSGWADLIGTQNTQTYSLSPTNTAWGTNTVLRIRCLSNNNFSDEVTIVKIVDGAQGATGATGATGPAGTAGSSARVCFARVSAGTPSGTATTSGNSSFPLSTAFGLTTNPTGWFASDPNPSSTFSLYQSDGIYNPSTNETTWATPYLSSLKVGSLSAITVNTGGLTVSDFITGGSSPNVSGSSMTGSGFRINSSGSCAFGNSTRNLSFNGSTLTMNGDMVVTGNIQAANISQYAFTTNANQYNIFAIAPIKTTTWYNIPNAQVTINATNIITNQGANNSFIKLDASVDLEREGSSTDKIFLRAIKTGSFTNTIKGSCHSRNGVFVVVGTGGFVAVSNNGLDWSKGNSGTTIDLNAVTYSHIYNRFIAVGNSGTIIISQNGFDWTPVSSGTSSNLNAVCAPYSYFYLAAPIGTILAGGSSGTLCISTNGGSSWSSYFNGVTFDIFAIAYTNGYSKTPYWTIAGSGGIIRTSTNGTTFTTRTLSVPTTQTFRCAVYEPVFDRPLVAGDGGVLYYGALENSNFTAGASGTTFNISGITSSAIGSSGGVDEFGNPIPPGYGGSIVRFCTSNGSGLTRRTGNGGTGSYSTDNSTAISGAVLNTICTNTEEGIIGDAVVGYTDYSITGGNSGVLATTLVNDVNRWYRVSNELGLGPATSVFITSDGVVYSYTFIDNSPVVGNNTYQLQVRRVDNTGRITSTTLAAALYKR
jgi:hypothetical protein